jgi:hypothetical protein
MTSTDAQHGFLWSNGTMTDLGDNFIAAAVNDNGAVLWRDLLNSGGTVQNLNNLIPAGSGYQITYAKGINERARSSPRPTRHLRDPRPAAHPPLTLPPRYCPVWPAARTSAGALGRAFLVIADDPIVDRSSPCFSPSAAPASCCPPY